MEACKCQIRGQILWTPYLQYAVLRQVNFRDVTGKGALTSQATREVRSLIILV